MAFKRLRELRDRFEQQWINGGFIFGYENEVNENHNNDYPLLVVLPPTSELPETEGSSKEDYTFECLIVKPYFQNHTGSLDVVLSLLEQEALTWLQRVLDSYTSKEVILSPDSISVEREKELYNDKLIQVRLTFTLNAFSHHFSHYGEVSISDLSPSVWLRSDLGVKTQMFGGNEVVTRWKDQSGNSNDFIQATSTKQPSYEYEDTTNGYPYLSFDGTDDFLQCVNNGISANGRGIAHEHTIFLVTKVEQDATNGYVLTKDSKSTNLPRFIIESRNTGSFNVLNSTYSDDDTDVIQTTGTDDLSDIAVYAVKFHNKQVKVVRNGTQVQHEHANHFDDFDNYDNARAMVIGADEEGSGRFLDFNMQEMIIFNDDLTEEQVKQVSTHLQHKYNI